VITAMIIAVVCGSVGDIFLKIGMEKVGPVSFRSLKALVLTGIAIFKEPTIIIGIICLAGFFFLWLTLLSWADLSFVLPLTALSYITAPFLAGIFLNEIITPLRWMGIVIICIGVIMVTWSGA
jgi:drug/metabolite transporter (DMT)-like permease